ncbi:MAG TPA: thiamine-phosphate kinase [Steroidobacteraceae bacterium]|nr:thiamine-phosphate kinase [Steroidobacteraceae bacterium]
MGNNSIDRFFEDSALGIGEFELIERFFLRSASRARAPESVLLGIGDDAALLRVPVGSDLVAAVDTIVAGRHFLFEADARCIGHRALAVNLSDFAAMGACPAWATLALTLPSADPVWLEGFAAGLWELADRTGVALVGGDTTGGPLTVSLQLLGHVPRGTAVLRSGARPGDLLAVTGTLGDAGAGLWLAQARDAALGCGRAEALPYDRLLADELIRRFEYPEPRVQFGLAARGIATAAMDVSDGLVGDLPKLAAASRVSAKVEVDRLPLSRAMRELASPQQARDWALAAGDDYELLLAFPPDRFGHLAEAAARLGLALTAIGEVGPGSGVTWVLNGQLFDPGTSGYDHFR